MAVMEITYQGKTIIYSNNTGLKGEALLENMNNVAKLLNSTVNKVGILHNFSGAVVGPEFMKAAKEVTFKYKDKILKIAMFGLSPEMKVLLNLYNMITKQGAKAFSTENQAKDWLIADDKRN
jgi:hypothetical protein